MEASSREVHSLSLVLMADPIFGRVEELLILLDILVLLVHVVKTQYFNDHYHAFVVEVTAEQSYLLFDN